MSEPLKKNAGYHPENYGQPVISPNLDFKKLPQHIAFIMDGNGRWAAGKGRNRVNGHLAGTRVLKEMVKTFLYLKIPVMTIYAFSTENWQRSETEVSFLMKLFEKFITKECPALKNNGVKLRFIGEKKALRNSLQKKIAWAENETAGQKELILNVAINYGARKEIIDAVSAIMRDIENKKASRMDINEETFASYLYTAGLPDPDLVIRTSGEMRLSNYLLWQIAYSELWITKTLWPDFSQAEFLGALTDYQKRKRRFGRIS